MFRPIATLIVVVGTLAFGVWTAWTTATPRRAVAQAPSLAREATGVTVTDERGRVLTFTKTPTRFAACSSFALETLMALGVEPVVRIDVPPVFPEQAESIPVVDRSHSTGPDVEKLIAMQPDAILLHNVFGEFADSVQQTVGVPVILHQVKSLEQVRQYIEMLGRLTGKTERAQQLLDDVDATVEWIQQRPVRGDKPRVLSLFGTNDAWYAHRRNAFMGDLLDVLGVDNIAAEAEAHERLRSLAPIDLERVIAQDPDVIFVIPYNDADPQVIKDFMAHPAFRSLRAVRTGRAHLLEGPIYTSHAGPRAGVALRTLYGLLYPDQPQPPSAAVSTP